MSQQPDLSADLATLMTGLNKAGITWDGENIADVLWLAHYIDPPAARSQPSEVTAADEETPTVIEEFDDRAPEPLPDIEPELVLYGEAADPEPDKPQDAPRKGIPFQTPTAPALRKTLALGRALRPLMRKVDSYRREVLDEDATAAQMAEQGFCMTVVRPARERWLELALVIEDSASSFLWRETIRDFQQVLERQGAFRAITTWYLQTTNAGANQPDIKLFAQRPSGDQLPRSRNAKELLDASGRRLILIISDCISPAWQQGTLQANYLSLWAKHGPLAVVQMLPMRLWRRTALSEGVRTTFSARMPGAANSQLLLQLPAEWGADEDAGLALPVMTLTPASTERWAKMLAGFGDARSPGVWFERNWFEKDGQFDVSPLPGATVDSGRRAEDKAAVLVGRFVNSASDLARELAALMALVPVELPLIYIIQAKLLPDSTMLHVAEVFLSGLVERAAEEGPQIGGSLFARKRRYEFVPGVRKLLIDTVATTDAEIVLNEISAYIGERLGRSIYSFQSLLRLQEETDELGEDLLAFASVTKQALRRLGGEYASLVDDIERPSSPGGVVPPPSVRISFPPLDTLTFEYGALVDERSLAEPDLSAFPPLLETVAFQVATLSVPQPSLAALASEVFEFQTATLEFKRAGLLRRQQWVVTKRRMQGRQVIEKLGENERLAMVSIPAGTFLMGSPEDEPQREDREGPQHEVTVPPFLMGRYPVTQAQWRFVAGLPQVNLELNAEPSSFKGDNRPVERVNWYDAVEFCDRLQQHTGRPYRLPSEAEWEYACRAGTTTPFHFGETLSTEVANYDSSSTYANGPKGTYRRETTAVNAFDVANAYGLCDMHGNVLEWCADHYGSYEQTPADGSEYLTENEEANRILRGGAWIYYPRYCRSAYRDFITPSDANSYIGFRVCCSAPRT